MPTDCIDDFYGTNCMIAYHGVFLEYIQRCSDREVLVMEEKDNMRQRCLYHMISNKYPIQEKYENCEQFGLWKWKPRCQISLLQ